MRRPAASVARVPVLHVDGCLLVTLPADIEDAAVEALQDELAAELVGRDVRGVLIDVSALDVVDSFAARTLGDVARTAALMSAPAVVAGIRPAVATTLVEMGVTIPHARTALDAERGLAMLGIAGDITGGGA